METSITECKAREKILSDVLTRRPGASMKEIQEYYDQTIVKLGRDTRELEKTLGTIKETIWELGGERSSLQTMSPSQIFHMEPLLI